MNSQGFSEARRILDESEHLKLKSEFPKTKEGIFILLQYNIVMKTKERRFQFNTFLNKEEHDTIEILRNKYAINISGVFKLLLKQYKEQLEKSNVYLNIQNKTQ